MIRMTADAQEVGYETLVSKRVGAVLHITLSRPEVRNAMSLRMVTALHSALETAQSDGGVRVLVLRGAGGHFCAGADLKDMAAARSRPIQNDPHASDTGVALDGLALVNRQFGELCVAFAETPLALVAVLEGSVMRSEEHTSELQSRQYLVC